MNQAELTDANSHEPANGDPKAGGNSDSPGSALLTPLTGRDTEVGLLADRWEQAQEGAGQVVLIVGEPGLGKSRLVKAITQLALAQTGGDAEDPTPRPLIIEWRCSQRFQNTEMHPASQHLERFLDFDREESTTVRFDRLAHHLEDCGVGRPDVVALFAKLLFLPPDERFPTKGLTPVREREETFRVLREWLRALSRRHPILFVVEDLHWIDASSLEFLQQFMAESLEAPLLTVLTFRPEFQTSWLAAVQHTSVALNRLTRRQVGEMIRRDADGTLPDSLVAQIYKRTGGVPLLVEEFSRMVRESALFETARKQKIPATLQQLVMARLDRMSSNREVAQFAATLGREFHYELLAAVVNVDEPTLQAELAKLTRAEILHIKGPPPNCAYQFKHALLEEALHSALDEPEKRQIHRHVAEVMETRFPQSAAIQPELLAQHFTEAGHIEKAVGYWLAAGRRSQDRFANVEAISHLTKGLELLGKLDESPTRDARELELLGPLGTAYIAARGYAAPEVEPVFQRASSLAERAGQTQQAFAMMRGRFAYHIVRGDFRLCTELAALAVQFGERLDDAGILMEALFLEGLSKLYRGDFSGAHDCCARAIADYDDRDRTAFWAARTGEDSGVTHRCYLALACWHLGCPDRALALNREAVALARSLGHPFTLEYALHHSGWLHHNCRLGAEAQAAGDEEMRIATEQGFVFWHASGSLYSAAGMLLRGRLDKGLRLLLKGVEAYRATGACLGLPYYLGMLGEAFTLSNRFEEARASFDEALSIVEANDDRFHEAELHRLRGELHLAEANDEDAAGACFHRAIQTARRQSSRAWELRATMSQIRLWRRQGRRHEAFTALTAALGLFTEGSDTPDILEASALLQDIGNEQMRDDIAAGIKYVRGCIPPPMDGVVAVDWRYVPSSTLGGDTIGYHWVDEDHLAFYLIDVTGHGMDSALLSVTISHVLRSGSLSGADMRRPEQVLMKLNKAFQGPQHAHKYFSIWYGVYRVSTRTLSYSSGGHPPAIVILPGGLHPLVFPATGPLMGVLPEARFSAETSPVPAGARLIIFSDGVFEIRRDKQIVWSLDSCVAHLAAISQRDENLMDALLAHVRGLCGSSQLDDDFSIIEARLH